MPVHIILYQPEIPPNTGNVMRLAANTGARLHLIAPLGFALDDARMRRAGLDYRDWVDVTVHERLEACLEQIDGRLWAYSTRGRRTYTEPRFERGDGLLFGPETRGLPEAILRRLEPASILRLPMTAASRSLNLSNAVAVAVFEAWRQLGFEGGQ